MLRTALPAGMLILALAIAPSVRADDTPASSAAAPDAALTGSATLRKTEFTWGLDPYDSSLGLNVPLTDKPIPTIQSDDYAVLFRDLMEDSLVPHYMQLQGNIYPVPVLGTWLKSHSPHTYKKGDLSNTGVNLVESSSTSYQEPWSVSAFFGNIADLALPGEIRTDNDIGYSGWLVSAGAQRLKDNELIQDKWYKLEWQIRGDLDGHAEKLSWNFRVGSKFNANPYVTDVTYIGIERNNLDLNKPFLGWLNNSHFDLELSFSHDGGRVVREQFIIGKKYPFPERGYAITLDTGLVWDSPYEYSGPLRDSPKSDLTLVFQPSIEF
ncbi:MAG: hypothetical protein ACHQAU_04345 [Gammaproteobacteria bacterium]